MPAGLESPGPSPIQNHGLCLLSLDGGGVRGLSSLYILECIMNLVNSERQGDPVKPCDVFDLMGGTSTGGLIAIMLGRLEMDVQECIDAYRELMKTIFSEKYRAVCIDLSGNVKAQYDSRKLRLAIEEVIRRAGYSPSALLNDGEKRKCRVFVCATSKATLEVTRLRSYDALDENAPSPTICEAALATSAATRFFDPVSLGDRQYVDGAFGANNPVEEVEEEACDIWCPSARNLQALVKCLLSIGTGHAAKQALDDNIFKFLSKTLVKMATKPAGVERRFMSRWRRECNEKRCFRFNVEEGLENVRMTEYHKRSLIETATHDYLHHPVQKSRVRDCSLNLARKKGKCNFEFASLVQAHSIRAMHFQIEAKVNGTRSEQACRKPPAWMVPFPRNSSFVDREILVNIKSRLFMTSDMSTAAIYGLGGVGKTQIALELAYQVRQEYPECSILWIPAMSHASILQGYLDIARQLGLVTATQEPEVVLELVCEHLSQTMFSSWLLIVDNADDLDMWQDRTNESNFQKGLRNYLPSSSSGRILLTTRYDRIGLLLAPQSTFHVRELDLKSASRVLKSLLINKDLMDDQESVQELLAQLTHLPLAIAQAAAFINHNSTTIQAYISLLNGQEQVTIDLLSEEFEDRGRYETIRNPVSTTWLTSFAQIGKQNPLASELLSFMACLTSRDIPMSILPCSHPVEQERAIGLLCAYSLAHKTPDGHKVNLHRLVHLAMRNSLRLSGTLQSWEELVLQELCKKWPAADPRFRRQWQLYLPHAFHILATMTTKNAANICAELQWGLSNSLYLDGRHDEGIRLVHQVISYKQSTLGPEHPDTLRVLHGLMMFYDLTQQYEPARVLGTQLLETSLRLMGHDSPGVAVSLGTLASVHMKLHHYRVAEWLCISAIKGCLKHFGPESMNARSAIATMVQIYLCQGRLQDATRLMTELRSLTIRVCGVDGQDTLLCETMLASIYVEQDLWREAEAVCADSLVKHRKLLGLHHPATFGCMYTLGGILSEQGRYKEASVLDLEAAHEFERLYGPEHSLARSAYKCAYGRDSRMLIDRIADRITIARKRRAFLERRRLYPRVRLYGGLYCPRRPITDDSIIRLVQQALQENPSQILSDMSCGSLNSSSEKAMPSFGLGDEPLDRFEFPSYMKFNTNEPKFPFGGGLFT